MARALTELRGSAIYALLACAALSLALHSCSQPQQPMPPREQSTPTNFTTLPEDAQFTRITAGKYHACGLKADGTALCWGSNIRGSLNVPDGLTFSRISAGLNFTCGLRIDGAIACWGSNNHAKASPPDGSFDEIAAGRAHACALDDGALICWGRDFPDGAETIQEIPPLSTIQAGAEFTCGLTPDADAACWDNRDRELAITPGPFASLAVGLHHACAIKVDGSVFCGDEDQLRYSRHSDPPSTKFVQISGGWFHACGITETSDIECWGSGERGMPGDRLSAPEGEFTAISIGWRNSCALRANGRAVCWHTTDWTAPPNNLSSPQHTLNKAAPTLESHPQQSNESFRSVKVYNPVELFPLPNGRIAVVERNGTITAYSDEPNAAPPKTILDLTHKTPCCRNEDGMFSAALDPQFEEFPFLYVYYTIFVEYVYSEGSSFERAARLARFRIVDEQAVKNSELTILEVPQSHSIHYGGAVRFGADGMLYLGIGDDFQAEKSQSLNSLLGKIIRIDVRGATPEQPYRIPLDNPFVYNYHALPEIWAYGLRNPWRMDFTPDGRLFIADVGAFVQEEVSLAASGANLGWPMCEGNICEEGAAPDADGLTAPLFTYGREDGCAIIGGVTAPSLNNGFVFGDHCSGKVWLLEQDEQENWQTRALAQTERRILSFGIGSDGTVYILAAWKPLMPLLPEKVNESEE